MIPRMATIAAITRQSVTSAGCPRMRLDLPPELFVKVPIGMVPFSEEISNPRKQASSNEIYFCIRTNVISMN